MTPPCHDLNVQSFVTLKISLQMQLLMLRSEKGAVPMHIRFGRYCSSSPLEPERHIQLRGLLSLGGSPDKPFYSGPLNAYRLQRFRSTCIPGSVSKSGGGHQFVSGERAPPSGRKRSLSTVMLLKTAELLISSCSVPEGVRSPTERGKQATCKWYQFPHVRQ